MEQSWTTIAQTGNINALYELFKRFPNLLEEIDNVSFIDTPVHLAASAGHAHFAIEVLRLKPSFGRKPNPDGFIPLVLALRSEQHFTVMKLVFWDPELIRAKSKFGYTFLHYLAEADRYADLLEAFLSICPESIEDVTIRRETAIHIAVKSQNVRALKLMLTWLERTKNEVILNRTDDEGNTVLHAASSTNNLEAVSLLIKKVDINITNVQAATALDVNTIHPNGGDDRIREILRSPANSKESLKTRFLRELNRLEPLKSMETINAHLVIAALIVTATYQSLLSPPGGISSGADDNSKSNTTGTEDPAGKAQMRKNAFYVFLFLNTTAFFASTWIMVRVLIRYINNDLFLKVSLLSLYGSYAFSATAISPASGSTSLVLLTFFTASLVPIAAMFGRAYWTCRK